MSDHAQTVAEGQPVMLTTASGDGTVGLATLLQGVHNDPVIITGIDVAFFGTSPANQGIVFAALDEGGPFWVGRGGLAVAQESFMWRGVMPLTAGLTLRVGLTLLVSAPWGIYVTGVVGDFTVNTYD